MVRDTRAVALLCSSSSTVEGRDGRWRDCGVWAEELVRPWKVFLDYGFRVVVVSPDGEPVPIQPASVETDSCLMTRVELTDTLDFLGRHRPELERPVALGDLLEGGHADGVFVPGGYGPTAQLRTDDLVGSFMERCLRESTPVAAVCHGVSALLALDTSGSAPVPRSVTGFSNAEERAAGADTWVPFLLETELVRHGFDYSAAPPWSCHVLQDGSVITGQNPASSEEAAKRLGALM
ncbi:type 1 glutamine amidotransferase domain-containing protein [Nocardiopsis sp. NPDC055551]|uniref:type 1 glutamine amidotransferase domain-containing protein n=1 Tax=Nocardiopsis sp. NPDC006832 TaxID=3157188 RepID=UPI003407BE21